MAEAATGISVGSQPGEQVPTTRSPAFDESLFSPTTSVSVISASSPFSSPYSSPLLNKRRLSRIRPTTLGMKRNIEETVRQPTSTTEADAGPKAPALEERVSSVNEPIVEEPNTELRPVTRKSKSYPSDLVRTRDELLFERRPSLKQRFFGGLGRSKSEESETKTPYDSSQENDNLLSKEIKSKRRSFMERLTSSRPLSAAEIPANNVQQNLHRTKSDGSTRQQCLTRSATESAAPQALLTNDSPSNASYHTMVSILILHLGKVVSKLRTVKSRRN